VLGSLGAALGPGGLNKEPVLPEKLGGLAVSNRLLGGCPAATPGVCSVEVGVLKILNGEEARAG